MSITSDTIGRLCAVVLGGGLLAVSGLTPPPQSLAQYLPAPAKDDVAIRDGMAIVRRGDAPLHDMAICDPIKAMAPNQVVHDDHPSFKNNDVILCFRDGIDYRDAMDGAKARGLAWERGLGGNRLVVLAPDEQTFLRVARSNHLDIHPGDLHELNLLMDSLHGDARAHPASDSWLIDPSPQETEALYGPYTDLPSGAYQLRLDLRSDAKTSCDAAMRSARMDLSVVAEARTRQLAPRRTLTLTPAATDDGGCLMTAEATFSTPGPAHSVETPIWIRSTVPLHLVGYAVDPVH